MDFATKTVYVYCEVQTEHLNKVQFKFSLQILKPKEFSHLLKVTLIYTNNIKLKVSEEYFILIVSGMCCDNGGYGKSSGQSKISVKLMPTD